MTGTWQERIAAIQVPHTPEQAARRAAIVVALHARDADDEAMLLDALGLNGRRPAVNYTSGGLLSRGRREGAR